MICWAATREDLEDRGCRKAPGFIIAFSLEVMHSEPRKKY